MLRKLSWSVWRRRLTARLNPFLLPNALTLGAVWSVNMMLAAAVAAVPWVKRSLRAFAFSVSRGKMLLRGIVALCVEKMRIWGR